MFDRISKHLRMTIRIEKTNAQRTSFVMWLSVTAAVSLNIIDSRMPIADIFGVYTVFFSCVSSLHSNMMYSISEFVGICRICAYWSTNQPTVSITPHITDAWARAQRKRNVLCGHTQTVTNRREEIIFVFFMSKIVFIHVFVWSVLLLQRSFAVWHAFFITIGLS